MALFTYLYEQEKLWAKKTQQLHKLIQNKSIQLMEVLHLLGIYIYSKALSENGVQLQGSFMHFFTSKLPRIIERLFPNEFNHGSCCHWTALVFEFVFSDSSPAALVQHMCGVK